MNMIFIAIGTLLVGLVFGFILRKLIAQNQIDSAENKATNILEKAKIKAKKELIDAKDKANKSLEGVKEDEKVLREKIHHMEDRWEKKEQMVEARYRQVEKEKRKLFSKGNEIKKIRKEITQARDQQLERLTKIAGMDQEQAKKVLLSLAEKESKDEIVKKIIQLEKEKTEELDEKARELMVQAMQRYAGSQSSDTTTTTVDLPSDELKGRIIGREGRNIKALERLTGAEIIVDDTPEVIVISGFDPLRREIAKEALQKLMKDGRIHPSRIEEAVVEAKNEVNKKIKEAGEAAVYDVGIAGLNPKLIQLIGRLRFRTSYGQNVLLHSIEVAHLSGLLASELGLNPLLAKKSGLLHDIGKAVDHEIQGTHIEIGINILKKFQQPQEIINAMKSHHEDYPFESAYAYIIAAADALSASRPGARKDTLERYLKRLKDLEDTALSFDGVEKCYAIQAGREVRVFVNPQKIDDLSSVKLAKRIAEKIEEDLSYPGEIKVNILRETRSVEYAR